MSKAITEVRAGFGVRATAGKYNLSERLICHRMKKELSGEPPSKMGRPTTLTKEEEGQLAQCIGTLCKLGFSPTKSDLQNLVKDYVVENNLTTPFKNNCPGKDWIRAFMIRNNLSLKKANMISSARKSSTANPFIIYDFYDVIEKIITENNLGAANIWNCDESGFPHDPAKCLSIGPKGEVCYKVTCGAGRENTTTLAVVSASGRVLDPLIIFKGKNFQSTWRGTRPLGDIFYGVSDKGWMTTDIFAEWFDKFCNRVTERPLLLIFDGHLTHISINVIQKAINEQIFIVKLPPHVTDKLQPLDVTGFGPLKRMWEAKLNEYVNICGASKSISKSTFIDLLSDIWHEGLSPKNVISGFEKTGIFPVNREKFPIERLDSRLVKRYNQWTDLGRPDDLHEAMATAVNTPKKQLPITDVQTESDQSEASRIDTPRQPTPQLQQATSSTPNNLENCNCDLAQLAKKLGPMPPPLPGKVWVPGWCLQDELGNKSFDELLLDRIKGPTTGEAAKKRRKVHMKTKIITDNELLEELKQHEREEKEKEEQKLKRAEEREKKNKKNSVKKKISFRSKRNKADDSESEEEESDIASETEDEIVEDDSDESEESGEERESKLIDLWKSLCPPVQEDDIQQKWYGVIYTEKKNYLYIGKVIKRFLDDVDGPTMALEIDCLKPQIGSGSILESYDPNNKDIGVFPTYNIIYGPLTVEPLKGNKWLVTAYEQLKEFFNQISDLKRKELFNIAFKQDI